MMVYVAILTAILGEQEVQPAAVIGLGKSVSRINYGVYFTYRATIKPVTDIWYHTFKVNLPSENWMYQISNRDDNTMKRNCLGLTAQGMRVTLQCSTFRHNAKFLTKIHEQGMENLHELSQAIHSLIPTETRTDSRRTKKAFLPFLGTIMKGLFGVSTETDVKILEGHVRQMAELQDNQLKIFKGSQEHLSSFIAISNQRINELTDIFKNSTLENMRLLEAQGQEAMSPSQIRQQPNTRSGGKPTRVFSIRTAVCKCLKLTRNTTCGISTGIPIQRRNHFADIEGSTTKPRRR